MVRLMMENTLLSLIKSNYNSLVQFIEQAIPEAVVVRSAAQVENHYSGTPKEPLFQIELVKTLDLDITYSTRDLSYVHVVLALFEKTLDEFAKIPDIEPAILAELYKSQKNETFIKSPIKSKDRPKMPDPN
jgi:dynein heavy chain, axonemal